MKSMNSCMNMMELEPDSETKSRRHMENLKNLWVNLSRNPFKRKGYKFYKGFWRTKLWLGHPDEKVWVKPHWKRKKIPLTSP